MTGPAMHQNNRSKGSGGMASFKMPGIKSGAKVVIYLSGKKPGKIGMSKMCAEIRIFAAFF